MSLSVYAICMKNVQDWLNRRSALKTRRVSLIKPRMCVEIVFKLRVNVDRESSLWTENPTMDFSPNGGTQGMEHILCKLNWLIYEFMCLRS
jgi:hypothetical protein